MESRELSIILRLKDEVSRQLKGVGGSIEALEPTLRTVRNVGVAGFTAIAGAATLSIREAMFAETAFERFRLVLKNSSKASEEQVQQLAKLADEMEKVGVISDDVTMTMFEELASFNLTSDSIRALAPAAADFATALYGINPTAEQAKLAMTGLGKVMNGQFEILTKKGYVFTDFQKKLFETGTETEKVAELTKILNDNYGGLNERLRQTSEGGLAGLQFQLGDIQKTIGTALIPVLESLVATVTPVLEKVAVWIEQNPELTKNIILVSGAIFALLAILASLGLAIGAISAAVSGLGVVLGLILSPFGLVVLAIAAVIAAGVLLYKNWDAIKAKALEFTGYLRGRWEQMKSDASSAFNALYDNSIGKLTALWDKAKEYAEKIRHAISSAFDKDKKNSPSIADRLNEMTSFAQQSLAGLTASSDGWAIGTRHAISDAFAPSSQGAAGGQNIVVDMSGSTFLDTRAAEKIGDLMIQRLKLNYQQ